ncbi:glycosyltransferase family 4 protein [Rufibacter glacialis]|uniref:Glycosyltransferase family 4 protein n=1 Tax=Rufibacter glacialis TaxID=1259555 RepID=A0A5M8QNA1_9BACT|nr:glycosyltransferase family 4 protein [Rufibacter glacialis]KAA6437615.1 glycosyltransferase family 4 protein [Rufibacter glacialis]GGK57795.1 hypothetical protein GCM10011405_02350 [Rufibacter glacialis]
MGRSYRKCIIIVDNAIAITGALKASVASSLELRDRFNFIYVLPSGSTSASLIKEAGFAIYFLPFVEISRRPIDLLRYLPQLFINSLRLNKILKKEGASILHMNDFFNMTGVLSRLLGNNAALVTHVRRMPFSFPRPFGGVWTRLNKKFSDKIICVSQAVLNHFENEPKAILVYDRALVEEKLPAKVVDHINQPQEIKFLYLSNYIQGKGQDKCLKAFISCFKKNNRIRLKFVGGDMGLKKNQEFKKSLEETVHQNRLEQIVTFCDFTYDIEKEIKDADVMLNFSESESFSLTCFESLYFGTPLIATDCGGPAELFENGVSGILVPVNDVSAMEKAILHLADSPAKLATFASEAKQYVRQKFDKVNTTQKLGTIYQSISR